MIFQGDGELGSDLVEQAQGDGELGSDLVEQAQVVRVKCVSASATKNENTKRAVGTQKRDATQGTKSFRQEIPCDLGFKALHLFFRKNQRGALLQGAASGTVMRADGERRKQSFAQREVFGLADQKPGTGVVQLEAGVFVAQEMAEARGDSGKGLLQVPGRSYDRAHV